MEDDVSYGTDRQRDKRTDGRKTEGRIAALLNASLQRGIMIHKRETYTNTLEHCILHISHIRPRYSTTLQLANGDRDCGSSFLLPCDFHREICRRCKMETPCAVCSMTKVDTAFHYASGSPFRCTHVPPNFLSTLYLHSIDAKRSNKNVRMWRHFYKKPALLPQMDRETRCISRNLHG